MYNDGIDSCVKKLNVQSCMLFAHFHVTCIHLITTIAVLCMTFCRTIIALTLLIDSSTQRDGK